MTNEAKKCTMCSLGFGRLIKLHVVSLSVAGNRISCLWQDYIFTYNMYKKYK